MRILPALAIALSSQLVVPLNATAEPVPQIPVDHSYLTFTCHVRVPGARLTPATYLFAIVRSTGGQSLIDVFTSDGTSHVTRFLAVEDDGSHAEPSERAACAARPRVLRGWFHRPGAPDLAFVYSQAEAAELALTSPAPVPYSTLTIDDADLVGAYPVAGLTRAVPLLLFGAGAPVALPGETSAMGRLITAAGSSFGPHDHLTAARLIIVDRVGSVSGRVTPLRQLGFLLDRLQRVAREGETKAMSRTLRGISATIANLNPPHSELARRGILPPPRDFILMLERIDAHVRAFARAQTRGAVH